MWGFLLRRTHNVADMIESKREIHCVITDFDIFVNFIVIVHDISEDSRFSISIQFDLFG